MPGKMVVLKPLVWNSNGYVSPTGERARSGFVGLHGYGHEEWNNDPIRTADGFRIFHTESKGRMTEAGERGELGIIMTAYHDKKPFVVGAATSVQANTPAESREYARRFNLKAEKDRLWRLKAVRDRHSKAEFTKHWAGHFHHNIWRAPTKQYHWFETPLPIDIPSVFPGGREAIVKMFNAYMPIRPDQAVALLDTGLDDGHPILKWLTTGIFDEAAVSRTVRTSRSPKAPKPGQGKSASTATDPFVRYLTASEIAVNPQHHPLQSKFEAYIISKKATGLAANVACVDVRFSLPEKGRVLAEVKPCSVEDARFAIRSAMGQLLDYAQRDGADPAKLIVLGAKPSAENFDLALSNGFGIAYPQGDAFRMRWP